MRKILFRGKRIDANGKWVCGDLLQFQDHAVIHQYEYGCRAAYEIDPSTVGQYTGLKDRNGVLIFEGDIIRYIYEPGKGFWNANQLSVIQYGKTGWRFDGIMGTNKYALMAGCLSAIPFNQDLENIPEFEVIGNIHDNPELLEV